MASDNGAGGGGGLEDMLGGLDLSGLGLDGMDIGALMKDLDPNTLQDLIMEGMKDPQIQEMVSWSVRASLISLPLLAIRIGSLFRNICLIH